MHEMLKSAQGLFLQLLYPLPQHLLKTVFSRMSFLSGYITSSSFKEHFKTVKIDILIHLFSLAYSEIHKQTR